MVFLWSPGILVGTQHLFWWAHGILVGTQCFSWQAHGILVVTWHLGDQQVFLLVGT